MKYLNHKSWYQRNWYWVLPLGFLTPVLLVVFAAAGLIGMSVVSKRTSDAYRLAVQEIQNSPEVAAKLGSPVQGSWNIDGRITRKNGQGTAELVFPVYGSDKEGIARVTASQQGAEWVLDELTVQVRDEDQPLVLKSADLETSQLADSH